MDDYFFRDGRNIGLSSCAIATSRICHDLWTPLEEDIFTPEIASTIVYKNRDVIDEYCVSRNLARFGLRLTAILDPLVDYDKLYHLKVFSNGDKNRILDEARRWYKENWK